MIKYLFLSLVILVVSFVGNDDTVAAAPKSAAERSAKTDLKRFFKDVKTYRARFTQVVQDETMNTLQEASGTLWIQRPRKFRWDYHKPYKQHIVGDGEKIWLYDVDLQQVTVKSMSRELGGTPAMLLAGRGRLSRHFVVKEIGEQDGVNWVHMTPRKKDSGFEDIKIGFKNGKLHVLKMVDGFGQTTRITLHAPRENKKITAKRFVFKPPDGVDIVGE